MSFVEPGAANAMHIFNLGELPVCHHARCVMKLSRYITPSIEVGTRQPPEHPVQHGSISYKRIIYKPWRA
jgi:hypothetical protein